MRNIFFSVKIELNRDPAVFEELVRFLFLLQQAELIDLFEDVRPIPGGFAVELKESLQVSIYPLVNKKINYRIYEMNGFYAKSLELETILNTLVNHLKTKP